MRARSIKPSFFSNDELAECPPLARLLFVGLWCMADRSGRLEERPKRIKAELLPYDTTDIEKLLASLASRSFITRYAVNGAKYIQINNFEKHQDPHVKERASAIPAPCEHGASTVPNPLTPDSGLLTPDSKETREIDPPPDVLPHVWQDWQRHRGKKLSREALRRQTERLAELKAMGDEPNAVILQSIERGWSGLFPLKAEVLGRGREPSLAEKRAANVAAMTGQRNERVIDITSVRVDSTLVPADDDGVRKQIRSDVG